MINALHMQQRLHRHSSALTIGVLLLASLFPLILADHYTTFLNDDSYITLTYAKNLASGRGFVFNHPPAVLGTTTPLFTIVVAGLALLFPQAEIATIAIVLTAFCWIGIIWTIFLFREQWGLEDWQAGIVSLAIACSGWVYFLGMEAYPFAFLLILSLSLCLGKYYKSTGFVTGLLFLTRGEGILILIVILATAVILFWREEKAINIKLGRIIINIIVCFAIPLTIWFVYAYMTFGALLPNTLAAKQAQGQNGLGRPFQQRLLNEWMSSWGKSYTIGNISLDKFWWAIIFVGLITALLRKRVWLMFAGWVILYIAGYILLNVSAYGWYQLPILFVLQLFFGLGLIAIIELITRYTQSFRISVGLSALLTAFLIAVLAKSTAVAMLSYEGDARGRSYTNLSRWLRDHTKSSETVAFIEIGYLGYYTDNRIIDLAGLTLPDIVPHIAKADFAWGFWQYRPDYYVYLPDYDWALANIRADSRFEFQYRPVATLHGPRDTDFVIYKRKDK